MVTSDTFVETRLALLAKGPDADMMVAQSSQYQLRQIQADPARESHEVLSRNGVTSCPGYKVLNRNGLMNSPGFHGEFQQDK